MKVARFLVAACCATETASAFVPSSSPGGARRAGHRHRRPTDDLAMAPPLDSSLMDPYSNPAIFLAGAGATFAAAIATIQKNKIDGGKSRKSGRSAPAAAAPPPRVDVSIPYDAAAALAYDDAARAAAESSTGGGERVGFGAFRSLYEAQVVAEVRAKARIRNLSEEAEALRTRLAELEGEIAGNGGDVASLNDEASGFRAQIRELFQ
jgi:hypothetical protein